MESLKNPVTIFLILGVFTFSALAQSNSTNNVRLCFNFSWLGPKYTNQSVLGEGFSCDNVTNSAEHVPCRHPLVTTYDGSFPNLTYLWENYKEDVTCMLTDDDVCVSYTHIFNGFVQNVTYMCTKVMDDQDESITSGCYSHPTGSRLVNLCIWKSQRGHYPINSADQNRATSMIVSALAGMLILKKCLFNID